MPTPPLTDRDIAAALDAVARHSTKQEAARSLGISPGALHNRLQAAKSRDVAAAAGVKIGGSAEHRRIIQLTDEVARLKRELESAYREQIDEEGVRHALKVLAETPESPPTWLSAAKVSRNSPEVPVAIWSDWHAGEVVSRAETNGINEYDTKVLKERVRLLVDRTLRLADKHNGKYPGLVLNLLGDFVSGGLHAELQKTDEVEPLNAALLVRDILVWAIGAMADRFGRVYLPCAAGNHGRNTLKPEFKRYVYKNYDWLIYQLLQRYFADDKRVQFDIRSANEVFYRVWGKRFLAMHGDMLGVKGGDGIIGAIGPITRGEIKVRGSSASAVSDYDTLLIGHWHQPLWLPRVIVANTLKGYDEFAKNALRAPVTMPSQPLFFVHPRYGITSRWEVYLEGGKADREIEWVSVFGKEAA